jgi:hypothetical protein
MNTMKRLTRDPWVAAATMITALCMAYAHEVSPANGENQGQQQGREITDKRATRLALDALCEAERAKMARRRVA